ncbi:hypothetical protein V1525DRAFT_157001 [Lipomyces kononenkoae]|uniref:Uncharacterized protein n=1 Tax=Lipomyces kononenkoae TaxID=34357 RepID=A0ACC3SPY2_LIPKO
MADNMEIPQSPTNQADGTPVWLQQFLQGQQEVMRAQQHQMLQLIQQQGQRLDQVTSLLSLSPNQPPTLAGQATSIEPLMNDTTKRPRAKLPDPEKFTGDDLSLFPQFLGKLQAKLEIDADAIGFEKDHVWYGFSRLEGKSAARIFPWMSAYKGSAEFSLENFYKQLRAAFEDPALKDKALNRLNTLRQGNRPFSDLMSELDRLLLEAGGHGWDDDVKKGYIRAAVNQSLRDKLITIEEKPTYDSYCLQVKGIADRLADFQRLSVNTRGSMTYRPPAARQDVRAPGPQAPPSNDPMDWEPSAARSSKRAKWVDKAELDRRRQSGSCLRCGSTKHFVNGCPFLPPTRPSTSTKPTRDGPTVSEIDVEDAILEDDDDYDGQQPTGGPSLQGKARLH